MPLSDVHPSSSVILGGFQYMEKEKKLNSCDTPKAY
jgi:hypothetical protein